MPVFIKPEEEADVSEVAVEEEIAEVVQEVVAEEE